MHRLIAAFAGLLLVACAGATPPPSRSPSPAPSASPGPTAPGTPTPTPSPSPAPSTGTDLYLRAWQTQALPPPSSFTNGAFVTVADGALIDSNVAVPAIFPGPLLILPVARPISPAGEQQIVDQLRDLGLLDGGTDFTGGGVMPGGVTGHLTIIVNGQRYELTGDPNSVQMCNDRPCAVDPATPQAFGAFWWLLGNTDAWLGSNLGQSVQYEPEQLAVLTVPPVTDNSGLGTNEKQWPLAAFASFGLPFGGMADTRCALVSGDDLAKLLPLLQAANQLTVFADITGEKHSVNVRALVPLEESPCTTA